MGYHQPSEFGFKMESFCGFWLADFHIGRDADTGRLRFGLRVTYAVQILPCGTEEVHRLYIRRVSSSEVQLIPLLQTIQSKNSLVHLSANHTTTFTNPYFHRHSLQTSNNTNTRLRCIPSPEPSFSSFP